MAVEKVEMFTVVCDNCKEDIGASSEYSCWHDENQAQEVAMESDWIKHEGKHICKDCYEYDDNDNLIIDEKRTNLFLT